MKCVRLLFVCLLMLVLCGCSELVPRAGQNRDASGGLAQGGAEASREWQQPTEDPASVRELSITVTERTIQHLEEYPNLARLDLQDSTCYPEIRVYIHNHPEVDVSYAVDMGGTFVPESSTQITLQPSGARYSTMLRNLMFLPQLRSVHLASTNMTQEQIWMLHQTYPDVSFTYSVEILGREVAADIQALDLSQMLPSQIEEVGGMLTRLPELTDIELMDGSECRLSIQDVVALRQLVPNVNFHYEFQLFGREVSTSNTYISFERLSLTPDCEMELRQALSVLSPGTTLVLDRCGLNSEFLASIRDDYDQVDLVWRVYFGVGGRYTCLTNDDTIRCVYNVTDDTCYEMRWLRSVKYMDLGHNDTLTDLSFLSFMPELEIAILSGCSAKALPNMDACKNLELLELANCMQLVDISALAGCTGLKYLNICYTKISDLSALDALPMQNLFCKQTRVQAEEQERYREVHPDTTAVFTGREAYAGPGWRYVDNGITFTDFYRRIREVFDLDSVDQNIRIQEAANQE